MSDKPSSKPRRHPERAASLVQLTTRRPSLAAALALGLASANAEAADYWVDGFQCTDERQAF